MNTKQSIWLLLPLLLALMQPVPRVRSQALEPWETPEGQICIDVWMPVTADQLNAYNSPDENFNQRKPWGFEPKYGMIVGRGVQQPAAPDAFRDFKNNRYYWMWNYYMPEFPGSMLLNPNWIGAGVMPIQRFVRELCLVQSGDGSGGSGSGSGGTGGSGSGGTGTGGSGSGGSGGSGNGGTGGSGSGGTGSSGSGGAGSGGSGGSGSGGSGGSGSGGSGGSGSGGAGGSGSGGTGGSGSGGSGGSGNGGTGGSGSGGTGGSGSGGAGSGSAEAGSGFIIYSRRPLTDEIDGTLWLINGDGSNDRQESIGQFPRLSHDARSVIYRRGGPDQFESALWVRDREAGSEGLVQSKELAADILARAGSRYGVVYYDWTPDNSQIVLDMSCTIWQMNRDGSNLHILMPTVECADDAPDVRLGDGMIAFHNMSGGFANRGVFLVNPDGSARRPIDQSPIGDQWPAWSPDGAWLAFVRPEPVDTSTIWHFYKMRPDGSERTELYSSNVDCEGPFYPANPWSRDGTKIVVAGTIAGVQGLYAIATDGSRKLWYLPTTPGLEPTWVGGVSGNVGGIPIAPGTCQAPAGSVAGSDTGTGSPAPEPSTGDDPAAPEPSTGDDPADSGSGAGSVTPSAGDVGGAAESGSSEGSVAPDAGDVGGREAPGFVEPASVGGMTLQAGVRRVTPGQYVEVPVYLINATNVANSNFEVAYDATVASVEGDVGQGPQVIDRLFEANASERGLIRIGFSGTGGVNGTGIVAYLPFRAVGQPGQRTELSLKVTAINDAGGATLSVERIAGAIEIVETLGPGDCDGDGRLRTSDAVCALRMSVGLLPAMLALDLDSSGDVNSRDATVIQQRALTGGR